MTIIEDKVFKTKIKWSYKGETLIQQDVFL